MKYLKETGIHVLRIVRDVLWFFALTLYFYCESVCKFFLPLKFKAKSVVGEIVLVTGGGGGIGRLIALKFSKLGTTVVVWDIKKEGRCLGFKFQLKLINFNILYMPKCATVLHFFLITLITIH